MSRKEREDKTLAMRVLEGQHMHFEVFRFDYEAIDEAADIAPLVGVPPESIYKTLVVLTDDPKARPLLVILAATNRLNPRRLAQALGLPRVQMARHEDAERLTGLKVGGISPLALLNRGFRIILDEEAILHEQILISAGQRGINLRVRVEDLLTLTGAELIDACSP